MIDGKTQAEVHKSKQGARRIWQSLHSSIQIQLNNSIYGSMNLLSKEDAEDNLMRVCGKDIAAELLEMTFSSEADMKEW